MLEGRRFKVLSRRQGILTGRILHKADDGQLWAYVVLFDDTEAPVKQDLVRRLRIDAEERRRGEARGKVRDKLTCVDEMLRVASG